METNSLCPEVELLERYASGRVSDNEAERLEEHLRACPPCVARLSTLDDGDELLQSLRAQKGKTRTNSALLDRLQEKLRNLGPPTETLRISGTDPSSLESTPSPDDSLAADEDLAELLAPAQSPDEIGRFGSYRVLRVLSTGGMGIIFEAEDTLLQRHVALKAIRPALAASNAARQRFLREARRMAALTHDHILAIHQIGEDRGVLFLVMPLLQGESLENRLRREERLPVAEVLRIGRETAQGLAAAHASSVIHRDVKPANLWLEAPSGRVKILDFGLARLVEGDIALTGSRALVGTPSYMAPEQVEGEADTRADLFSLGCVLYRLATGQPAFPGKTLASVLRALATENPPPARQSNPEVPEALSQLIERLLSKERAHRPASAEAVVSELAEIERTLAMAEPVGVAASPASPTLVPSAPTGTLRSVTPSRRQRWRRLAAVGILTGALAVAALAFWHNSSWWSNTAHPREALQVLSLDVEQNITVNGRRLPKRLLGATSFATHCNDGVEVEVRLSRPAYAFLIAFRPDGTEALCLPVKPDEAPPQTERFRYPPNEEQDYGLEEGAGLHVFAVVASSQPLPSFQQWWPREGCPWQKHETPPDVIWRTLDGIRYDELVADPTDSRGTREVQGKAPVVHLTNWLKQCPQVEAVSVLGFAVMP